jgi:beta-carotene hydroxylase
MSLRFVEDRRTLFWAFVLFPLVPALAYAWPALTLYLVPCSLYLSYCSGVLAHNHSHCPLFSGRRANTLYGAWLSIFYGFPLFAWVPTHNQNHHRYVNAEGDATRTTRHRAQNSLFALLSYPLASGRWQLREIIAYLRSPAGRQPAWRRRVWLEFSALILTHGGAGGLAIALYGPWLGAAVYLASVGLPALLATYFMMFTNYVQHVDCDASSIDDHSRNFTSPFWNWFVFQNGYHTVHHEQPGVHWSRYPALHAARAARIDPRLNVSSMFAYLWSAYFNPAAPASTGDSSGGRRTPGLRWFRSSRAA